MYNLVHEAILDGNGGGGGGGLKVKRAELISMVSYGPRSILL